MCALVVYHGSSIKRHEIDEEGENIDPITELMQKLIDYKRFRSAADILNNIASENSGHFKRHNLF